MYLLPNYLLFLLCTWAAQNTFTSKISGKKSLKYLIEILLRVWIFLCKAGEHLSSLFLYFFFCVPLSKMRSLSYSVIYGCIVHWRFSYSDIMVAENFISFLHLKHCFCLRLCIQSLYLVIAFKQLFGHIEWTKCSSLSLLKANM